MVTKQILDVHIGEIKLSKNGETLRAILGSCVGIALLWEARERCGLAHCLLPKHPGTTYQIGAKYVDQAVKSMVALMKIADRDAPNIRAVVVGGGNMTGGRREESKLVGACNFKQAVDAINGRGFKLVHSDGGGNLGRRIWVDGERYCFDVDTIPRISSIN